MHQHKKGIYLELPDEAEKGHLLLNSLMQGFQTTPCSHSFVIHKQAQVQGGLALQ